MIAYVCFTGRPVDSFVSRFLHKDFQHCFVVLLTENGPVKVDSTVDEWEIIPLGEGVITKRDHIIVRTEVKTTEFGIFGLCSCVSMVKRIIGMNKPFIFTPYQLYKELL